MNTTLYQITGHIAAAAQAIEDAMNAECSDVERDQRIAEAFGDLNQQQGALESKLENCAKWVKSLGAAADAIRREELELAIRRRSIERQAEHFKSYMLTCLKTVEGSKVKTPLVSMWIGRNASVVIDDPQVLPRDGRFWKIPAPEFRKDEAKRALKAGEVVTGVRLQETEHIVIK